MDAVLTPPAARSGTPGRRSPTLSEEERRRLSSEIWRISKAWVSQVAQLQQLDAAFAGKLASCTTTVEAAELCGSWMGHRVDAAVVAQHRLLEAWLESMTGAERRRLAADYGPGDDAGHEAVPDQEELQRHLMRLLHRLQTDPPDGPVLLLGHESVNRVLLLTGLGLPLSRYWRLRQAPCCVNRFTLADDAYVLECLNETAHLLEVNAAAG